MSGNKNAVDSDTLITLVQAKPTLWNQDHKNHHNRFALDKEWEDIAKRMGTTRQMIRGRWKCLRDSFRKELKKTTVGPSNEEYYHGTWTYFKKMIFLKDQLTRKPANILISNREPQEELNENSNISDFNDVEILETKFSFGEPELTQPDSKRARLEENSLSEAEDSTESNAPNVTQPLADKTIFKNAPLDEDESFFFSIMSHVKKLSPHRKLEFRIEIQKLVYNFLYKDRDVNKN